MMVMGRGSNLLVRDGGIRGVVVHLSRGEFKTIEVEDGIITAGVGVKLKELSQRGARRGDRRASNGWRAFRATSAAACA